MNNKALKVYIGLRFFSALFFAVIVTVNLVYQAVVVGLSPLQLVLVGTLLETVCFIFEIPTGIVADLYSRKLSVIIGVFLMGAGFVVEGMFPIFSAVMIAQIIWGIGATFVSGAREAWIADEIGEAQAGKAFIKGQQAGQAGTFVGIALSMILANIDIRLPIIIGGILYSSQAVFLAIFMPEDNFTPTPIKKRETFRSMKAALVMGSRLVRKNSVLLLAMIIGIIFGMSSEGLDRLWTPYLVGFSFPAFGNLKPVVWFGIISMAASIMAIIMSEIIRRNTDVRDHRSTARTLFLISSFLILAMIIFGTAGNFSLVALAYCFVYMFKENVGPIYDSWVNQNVETNVRATIFSMCSQMNSFGQIFGGPILGMIASLFAIKTSLIVSGLILVPSLFLFAYSLRNHKTMDTAYQSKD
jgi:DHA3 family tetracycline resistance protein-like MFS transporter